MPKISTRNQLIDYCLRNLGHDVIEINVSEDQIEDRIDDAMQYFSEYHFDGVSRVFLKHVITQADVNNGYVDMKYDSSNPNRFTSAPGASGQSQDTVAPTESGNSTYTNIEDVIASVVQIFHVAASTINMFDVRYQYALNDLYTFGTIDLVNYTVTQQYLSLLRQILSPEKSVRFSRKTNRLYIDMQWGKEIKVGDYIIIEAFQVLDAKVFPEVYNDMMLKRYATALIKRQWGANLSKFKNIQMPGGVSFNGEEIFTQASQEIAEIEKTIQGGFQVPAAFFTG